MKRTDYRLLPVSYIVAAVAGTALLVLTAIPGVCADDKVGTVVAVRGTATLERTGTSLAARVKTPVLLLDTAITAAASRAKLLFIDDSVLTVAENSRVSVKEFIIRQEGGGRSIFNLLEGKMRSVVGRQKFEVHTPTAVAAARGTVILFETGVKNRKRFTRIICLEGEVEVRRLTVDTEKAAILTAGMEILIVEGEPLPAASQASAATVRELHEATSMTGLEISVPEPRDITVDRVTKTIDRGQTGSAAAPSTSPDILSTILPATLTPPFQQQPAVTAGQPSQAVININIH